MKHSPRIEYVHYAGGGFYYVLHPGRNYLHGKYLGIKDGKVDWADRPIYFGSRPEASEILLNLMDKQFGKQMKEVTSKLDN